MSNLAQLFSIYFAQETKFGLTYNLREIFQTNHSFTDFVKIGFCTYDDRLFAQTLLCFRLSISMEIRLSSPWACALRALGLLLQTVPLQWGGRRQKICWLKDGHFWPKADIFGQKSAFLAHLVSRLTKKRCEQGA